MEILFYLIAFSVSAYFLWNLVSYTKETAGLFATLFALIGGLLVLVAAAFLPDIAYVVLLALTYCAGLFLKGELREIHQS